MGMRALQGLRTGEEGHKMGKNLLSSFILRPIGRQIPGKKWDLHCDDLRHGASGLPVVVYVSDKDLASNTHSRVPSTSGLWI